MCVGISGEGSVDTVQKCMLIWFFVIGAKVINAEAWYLVQLVSSDSSGRTKWMHRPHRVLVACISNWYRLFTGWLNYWRIPAVGSSVLYYIKPYWILLLNTLKHLHINIARCCDKATDSL